MRQLRLEDKRTLQLTSQNPNLQKVDCKKSGQVPTSHLFNRVPVFLGAGGESGVHPRSLLLLAGDIETNPGPGAEIIDVLDSGNELSTVEYERLDSSSNSIDIVRGNEDMDTSGTELGNLGTWDVNCSDGLSSIRFCLEGEEDDQNISSVNREVNFSGRVPI